MSKKYYVARGGRNVCLVDTYQTALLISGNKPEYVHEFTNYWVALGLLEKMAADGREHSKRPSGDFISVDVSVNNATGAAEFRVRQSGETLISTKSIAFCTSNIAEYLAIVEAHKYIKHYDISQPIYCDNIAAIKWFQGRMPVLIPPSVAAANNKLIDMVKKAMEYTAALPAEDDVVKYWDKSMWGEIPADYGRKKQRS